jgi:hypothetical protein
MRSVRRGATSARCWPARSTRFAGVREIVYERSTALATQHLQIVRSALGDRAGIMGAAVMAIEHVLAPDAFDRLDEAVPIG